MESFTIVDLTLHAATLCCHCRNLGRPKDDSSREQGDSFVHQLTKGTFDRCKADQVWVLIRRIEEVK
jgi:hypothetical protein